jgi:spore coat protein U-like protein
MRGRATAAGLLATLVVLHLGSLRAEAACAISTTPVVFGTYSVLSATATTSTGTVTITCGNDTNVAIQLGTGASGTYVNRELRSGAERLFYNLFRNAAMTIVWGDGTAGTQQVVIVNPPNNRPRDVTIYGRIPALQDAVVGAYTDTVVATVLF